MTSFAIIFYGECCRRHVVGQRIVATLTLFVVVEVFVACVWNVIILICYYACSLLCFEHLFASHIKHNLPYNMVACTSSTW